MKRELEIFVIVPDGRLIKEKVTTIPLPGDGKIVCIPWNRPDITEVDDILVDWTQTVDYERRKIRVKLGDRGN